VAEWLDHAGVTGWFRRLIDVAYTTEYGLETDRQSALNFLLMIDPNPEPFRIFGESDERFHVQGGNDRIVQALGTRLGDVVETGVRLESITQAADGSLRCDVRSAGRSESLSATHVVVAIPFTMLRDVRIDVEMPAEKRKAIRELGYGTNAKLMVGFSERFWREAGANGSVLTDLPMQLAWETSRAQAGRAGILTNFTGGRHGLALGQGTSASQAESFVRDLERVFPGASRHRTGMKEVRFHWPTNPYVRGSYASYLPGQWTGIRGVEGRSVGNLHFAGEHCSLEAQGFMEGGCETGEAAARTILSQVSASLSGRMIAARVAR
jgi:monoamine oxidase